MSGFPCRVWTLKVQARPRLCLSTRLEESLTSKQLHDKLTEFLLTPPRNRDALNDASLEPRDCLTLWNKMKGLETPEYPVDGSLDPEKCLPQLIKKADIVRW